MTTIGLVFLVMILAMWSFGAWLTSLQNIGHRPRYQGRYRTPCLDVTVRQDHRVHGSRPLEFC
jgi:hypothetical protein